MNRFIILSVVFALGCSNAEKTFSVIDIQGHRGARGLMPENTIPGFIYAMDLGVNTLEMDLSVTGDGQVIVSHEPYMNAEISTDSIGNEVVENDQLIHNIYKMNFEDVQKFDVGLKPHPRFPDQKKLAVTKPLLSAVVDTADAYSKSRGLPLQNFNIEIKSRPEWDDIYHPSIQKFSDLVYDVIDAKVDWSRVTIQSFDFRVLQYFNQTYPDVALALLIETKLPWKENIESLGFMPEIYSCDYNLLSAEIVSELQSSKMKVIPWTVNDRKDMDKLLIWGVDGIITDYPDRIK